MKRWQSSWIKVSRRRKKITMETAFTQLRGELLLLYSGDISKKVLFKLCVVFKSSKSSVFKVFPRSTWCIFFPTEIICLQIFDRNHNVPILYRYTIIHTECSIQCALSALSLHFFALARIVPIAFPSSIFCIAQNINKFLYELNIYMYIVCIVLLYIWRLFVLDMLILSVRDQWSPMKKVYLLKHVQQQQKSKENDSFRSRSGMLLHNVYEFLVYTKC